ncbi:helix-turn-helix transcriptional regulator [Streptacidiphilus anmyonensis]|uniref:helix-turn-helix transcriptional regulator n=1 Tax=Streptacidiphilus anmyonensis TaxID=405782 RepID=UPI0005A99252|nr:response regulator transcription factor [Streptacidiphilus anmyonensis]
MPERINVFVCATDPLSEAGLAAAVRGHAEVWLVGAGDVAAETVAVVAMEEVDDDALALVKRTRALGTQRVVAVVHRLDDAGLLALVESGACGLVRRAEATPDRLVQVVRSVRAGAGEVPSDLLGRLLEQVSRLQDQVLAPRGLNVSGLSDREAEVLRLVAQGLGTHEIAARLSYSERTVKNTLHDVTSRFHLRNRSHAVAFALQSGLI